MRILISHILILLLSVSFCKAQQKNISLKEMTAIMQKTNSIYTQKEYCIALEVYTYKGHYAAIPEDQSKGFILKKDNITEQYINHVYSIQNNTLKLMIDSAENIVGISYPDNESFSFTPDNDFIDKYNRYVTNITLTNHENGKQIIDIKYKEGLPYEKISIKLNNSFAEEVIFYYADKIEYEGKDGRLLEEKPKLRVGLKKLSSKKKLKFNINEIAYKNGNNYQLSEKFKNFQLIDFRYQN